MATAGDLIKRSMRLLGAIASGETPSSAEQADALSVLNQMLDSWSTENLAIYQIVREEFSLTSGQQVRTMGSGGNFDTTRPAQIEQITIEDQSLSDTPESHVQIINVQEWAAISHKSLTGDLPEKVYIESSYPLINLNFWPVPSAANKAVIYSKKPLSSFASASTTVSFPPGYEKAICYNLALELSPEYGVLPSEVVVMMAADAKANIKRKNIAPVYLAVDSFLSKANGFDWRIG